MSSSLRIFFKEIEKTIILTFLKERNNVILILFEENITELARLNSLLTGTEPHLAIKLIKEKYPLYIDVVRYMMFQRKQQNS